MIFNHIEKRNKNTSYKLAPAGGAVGIVGIVGAVGAVGIVGVVGYKLAPAGGGVQATSLHQRGERGNEGTSYKLAPEEKLR
ncbi:hypothetical protein CGC59_04590 [Capnocytophaga sputigena]|uniref:Uncharacterized protein n=1 Tax=Capnocytophaga sputigena TaxID=1019 RepID=A0A250F1J6_CAPSP|nr:hypothetical protein CGC59_04590 [Capnocytophaga sputigena]